MHTTTRRGPRKNPNEAVGQGVTVNFRIPRHLYKELQEAAWAEGTCITAYIRRLIFVTVDARKKAQQAS